MKDKLFRRKTKGRRNKCHEDSKAGAQRPPSLSAPPPGLPRLSVPGARAVAAREAPPSPDCLRALLVIFQLGSDSRCSLGSPSTKCLHGRPSAGAPKLLTKVPWSQGSGQSLTRLPAPPRLPAPGSRLPAGLGKPDCGSSQARRPLRVTPGLSRPRLREARREPRETHPLPRQGPYLPRAQPHQGHLGAVAEHDVAGHDC